VPVENQAEHLAQAGGYNLDLTAWSDLEDALGVELVRVELAQVADIEDTVVGNHRWNHVALGGRNIFHARDITIRRDLVHLTMIGLDGVEVTAHSDHAVPGAVGLEVSRDRIRRVCHRVRLLIRTQIGDHRPTAVGIYPYDLVWNARHAV
jgi:hypothetical protein